MRYEPFQQDGRWWFGVVHGGRPRYKTGHCATPLCIGHEYPEDARAHMKAWLISRMMPCSFAEPGYCHAEDLHLFVGLQRTIYHEFPRLARFLPLVTDLGYTCQSHSDLNVRLCQSHRRELLLERVMPEPDEVLA